MHGPKSKSPQGEKKWHLRQQQHQPQHQHQQHQDLQHLPTTTGVKKAVYSDSPFKRKRGAMRRI